MPIWEQKIKKNEINFIHEIKTREILKIWTNNFFFRPIGLDKVFFYGNLTLSTIKKKQKYQQKNVYYFNLQTFIF